MIDLPTLLAAAAELFDVEIGAIVGKSGRGTRITQARQAVAYVLREHDYLMAEIGTMLHRDHSTIVYSVQEATKRAASDAAYAAKLRALRAALTPTRAQAKQSTAPAINWRDWWT